jgi:hypothetical protein
LRIRIFGGLDVNATGRACCSAQETADTLFESIFIAVENVNAPVARLEMNGLFWIIFGDGLPQHVSESYAEAFYKRDKRFASFPEDGRHRVSV